MTNSQNFFKGDMMTNSNNYIDELVQTLPDLCTTQDLIKIGLYNSDQSAHFARKKNCSPPFFKFKGGKVLYPKRGVYEFLEKSFMGS